MEYSQQHRLPERRAGRRGYPQMEVRGSRDGHRYMDPRNMVHEGRQSMEIRHQGDSRSRESRKINFNESINELYDVISDGLGFYQRFYADFMRDTQHIQLYADYDLLDQLWNCKISKSSKPGTEDQGYPGRDDSRELSRRESDGTFKSTSSNIASGIKSTIEDAEIARNATRAEDAEHANSVRSKLRKNYPEIKNLLKASPFRLWHTKQLMTELEMLLTFLKHNGAAQNGNETLNDRHTNVHDEEPGYDDQQQRGQYDEEGSGDERAEG
ncbi:hypothetical protein G7Y79_00025g057560 [Physcia stellaris]|nr:hypothetical protein G7Y79_00025g057560 [Physcia stellaris]